MKRKSISFLDSNMTEYSKYFGISSAWLYIDQETKGVGCTGPIRDLPYADQAEHTEQRPAANHAKSPEGGAERPVRR